MYGLTSVKGLIKRGARAYGFTAAALVALTFLSATPTQAQGGTGKVSVSDLSLVTGLKAGQTLRATGVNAILSDGSVRFVRAHVKVFDSRGNVLCQTEEVEIPAGGFHSFDINRDDIPLAGEPRTGRVQIRLEMIFTGGVSVPTGQDEEPGAGNFPATLELVDNNSGGTIMALLLPAVQSAREAARK